MSPRRLQWAAAAIVLLAAGVVHAQATRTWVSGVGDDANPCSRTAPCTTFAGALSKTAAGGEIDALDPGDFGAVTITKAITLDGSATLGSTAGAGASGITISAGANDAVVLRALSLHGDGTHSGVSFASGASLTIERCVIEGFAEGIDFSPAAGGQLFVSDTQSRDNTDNGLRVQSGGAANSLATIAKSRFENNGTGILGGPGGRVDVNDSVASGNALGVSAAVGNVGGASEVNLEVATVSDNGTAFSSTAAAGTSLIRLSKVLGTGNTSALTFVSGGGDLDSFGNNRFDVLATIKLTTTQPSATVTAPQPATYPLQVSVNGVLANPITFACAGLPLGSTCQFTPTTLPAGARGGSVSLTVTTVEQPPMMGSLLPRRRDGEQWAGLACIPALALLGLRRRRHGLRSLLALALLLSLSALPSCGNGTNTATSDLGTTNGDLRSTTDLKPGADLGPPTDIGAPADLGPLADLGVPPDLSIPTDLTIGPDLGPIQVAAGNYSFMVTATSGIAADTATLMLTVK